MDGFWRHSYKILFSEFQKDRFNIAISRVIEGILGKMGYIAPLGVLLRENSV